MKTLLFYYILLCSTLFCGCEQMAAFKIVNRSEQGIIAASGISMYPDTVINTKNLYSDILIEPASWWFDYYMGYSSERAVYDAFKTDTLSFYIFSPDTIAKYGWTDVRENYRILKRYDLSFSDVESLDFTIYYPPTNAMRYMKMYPPFE